MWEVWFWNRFAPGTGLEIRVLFRRYPTAALSWKDVQFVLRQVAQVNGVISPPLQYVSMVRSQARGLLWLDLGVWD
jgi:hypothetical protein